MEDLNGKSAGREHVGSRESSSPHSYIRAWAGRRPGPIATSLSPNPLPVQKAAQLGVSFLRGWGLARFDQGSAVGSSFLIVAVLAVLAVSLEGARSSVSR
jgi:hypothetical protein